MPHKSAKTAAAKAKKAAQVAAGKKYVATKLGLTTVPNTPPPGQKWSGMDSPTSVVAMNLTGKDKWMFGEEASTATKEYMSDAGLGTYNKETGSFVNVVGNKIISGTDKIIYGDTSGAMGSGDPSGILSSTPISNKMLQSQNKIKTVIQGVIGAITPAPISTVAKLGMTRSSADILQPGAAYEDYTKKFQAKQAGKKFTSTRNLFGVLGLQHKKKTLGE